MASGVYKIQSISHPERVYIGSSNVISRRKSEHFYKLKKNIHDSPKLQNHYNKYGKDDLIFSIIVECDASKAVVKEQCYINIFKPWFNVSLNATSVLGVKRSQEFKDKVSKNTLGRKRSEETRKKESESRMGENNPFYGKTHTEESNDKRRQWNLEHGIKPPTYHGGRPKGAKNKPKS